jgi:hypothetical protein
MYPARRFLLVNCWAQIPACEWGVSVGAAVGAPRSLEDHAEAAIASHQAHSPSRERAGRFDQRRVGSKPIISHARALLPSALASNLTPVMTARRTRLITDQTAERTVRSGCGMGTGCCGKPQAPACSASIKRHAPAASKRTARTQSPLKIDEQALLGVLASQPQ